MLSLARHGPRRLAQALSAVGSASAFTAFTAFTAFAATPMPDVPAPEGSSMASLGEAMTLNGTPARLREVYTRQARRVVADWYQDHLMPLAATGRPRVLESADTTTLSGRLGRSLVTVDIADAQGGGTRTRILQSAPDDARPRRPPAWLPSGSRVLNQIDHADGDQSSSLLVVFNQQAIDTNLAAAAAALRAAAQMECEPSIDLVADGQTGRKLSCRNPRGEAAEILAWSQGERQVLVLQVLGRGLPSLP